MASSPYVDLLGGPFPSGQGKPTAGYPQMRSPYTDEQGTAASTPQPLGVPAPPESQPNANRLGAQYPQVAGQQQQQQYPQQQQYQGGAQPPQGQMGGPPAGPYVQTNPAQAHPRVIDNMAKEVNKAGKQAEQFAKNLWGHLSPGTSSSPSLSAVGKTVLGKVQVMHHHLSPQAAEKYWRDSFHPPPGEKFLNFFSCHLSTTTGPIVGTLFVSSASLTFISDRPVGFVGADGKHMSTDYKINLPLSRIANVAQQHHSTNPDEKYLQIITVDGHHFWFMAFLAYTQAYDTIMRAQQQAPRSVA
eukprot:TRINITY_DN595_c0_g1_i1.p1 TRINITY_DN595_c0_g1~~TRINITY_DN595_c0_g1_i1.p1  ORF type:complete len:301 (+),score=62.50 TRINITY_DN595_c0_g1_i1:90-992(+)